MLALLCIHRPITAELLYWAESQLGLGFKWYFIIVTVDPLSLVASFIIAIEAWIPVLLFFGIPGVWTRCPRTSTSQRACVLSATYFFSLWMLIPLYTHPVHNIVKLGSITGGSIQVTILAGIKAARLDIHLWRNQKKKVFFPTAFLVHNTVSISQVFSFAGS